MTDDPPTADSSAVPPFGDTSDLRELGVVTVLALNAFGVVVLIPILSLGTEHVASVAWVLSPLVVLLLSAALAARGLRVGYLALLALYPPALGAAMWASPDLVLRDAYDILTLSVGALSVTALIARAALASSRPRRWKPADPYPLVGKEPVGEPRARRYHRRALIAIVFLAGFSMIVLVPALPTFAARRAIWADAARDGAVLTVLIASVIASIAMGAVVGPALRAERPRGSSVRKPSWGVAAVIALVTFGLYLVLTFFDRTA